MGTAYEMGRRSMAMAEAKDREGWLALFAVGGTVEDPVGPSVFDPEGKGHRGIEAITAFYDNVIATSESVRFEIRQWAECGSECAMPGVKHNTHPRRQEGTVELGENNRVDELGMVASLLSFWEFERLSFS